MVHDNEGLDRLNQQGGEAVDAAFRNTLISLAEGFFEAAVEEPDNEVETQEFGDGLQKLIEAHEFAHMWLNRLIDRRRCAAPAADVETD